MDRVSCAGRCLAGPVRRVRRGTGGQEPHDGVAVFEPSGPVERFVALDIPLADRGAARQQLLATLGGRAAIVGAMR